jgi:hypothetical protein
LGQDARRGEPGKPAPVIRADRHARPPTAAG